MNVKYRRALSCLVVAIVVFLIFRRYYGTTLLFEDANLQWDASLVPSALLQLLHSWAPSIGAGRPSIIINETTAPLTIMQAALAPFGNALSTLLFYPLLLCLSYAGAWVAARKIARGPLAAHIVAAFVVGNPWIWDRILLGHIAIVAAVSVASWVVAALAWRVELGRAFAPVLVGLCGLLLACDARISYFVFVGLFILAGYWAFAYARERSARRLRHAVIAAIAPFAAFALNAWWSFAFFLIPGANPVREHYPALDEILSFSQFSDVAHNLVFSGTFLHFSWDRAASGGALPFALWYLGVFGVVVAALLARPRSAFLAWTLRIGVLASFLLSFGTSLLPTGWIYWLYAHVPFAMFFRDPNKFGYVGVTCCALLLCAGLRVWRRSAQVVVAIAVAAAVLPVMTGDLQTSIGAGLQAFPEHDDYVNVLRFVRSQPGFPDFRLGMIPPWTIETIIDGSHPVVEPFVFQYQIATMDAKAATIASDANLEAWRVYQDVYDGTDAHAGDDLARLGIGYMLWDENAVLSPGAQFSAFGNRAPQVVRAAVASLHFPEVYRSGPLHVYRNPAAIRLLRTVGGPAIAGPVAQSLRAALPAGTIGDALETEDAGPLPLPYAGIGADADDACRAQLPRSALSMAYDRASDHSDWTTYWVDSDYPQQFAGDAEAFAELGRYPLPYAVTASNAAIDFPIDVGPRGVVAVDGAVLRTPAIVEYAIDGGPHRTVDFDTRMRWVALAPVARGPHRLTIFGSRVGTVLRAVTAAPLPACAAPYYRLATSTDASKRGGWILPSSLSMVTVRDRGARFAFAAENGNGTTASVLDGPRADAITVDGRPVPDGVPLPMLIGRHAAWLFARGAPMAATPWEHWLAGADTGAPKVATFAFGDRYDDDEAAATFHGVPVNSTVVLSLPYAGDPRGAEVRITQGGTVTSRYPLANAKRPIAVTAYNDTIVVHVRRARRGGALRLLPPDASAGVVLDASTIDIASSAVPLRAGARFRPASLPESAAAPLVFADDDRSIVPSGRGQAPLPARGAGFALTYRDLRAGHPAKCTLVVTFETELGAVTKAVADVAVGADPRSGAIDVPLWRLTTAVAPHFECDDAHAILSARTMDLRWYHRPAGALVFERPDRPVAAPSPSPLVAGDRSDERFTVAGAPKSVVSLTSYDPLWTYGNNRHFLVDGTMNGWIRTEDAPVTYGAQSAYVALLALSTALWLALAAWLALAMRRR